MEQKRGKNSTSSSVPVIFAFGKKDCPFSSGGNMASLSILAGRMMPYAEEYRHRYSLLRTHWARKSVTVYK